MRYLTRVLISSARELSRNGAEEQIGPLKLYSVQSECGLHLRQRRTIQNYKKCNFSTNDNECHTIGM